MFNNDKNIKITNCDTEVWEYYDRVYQYSISRKYDNRIVDIYDNYQIIVDDITHPIKSFYVTFNSNSIDKDLHLISVKNECTDILTKEIEKHNYNDIVAFRDTTAFIKLIDSDAVIVNDKEKAITISDKEKANMIIKNWDGMLHDKVAETDAVEEDKKNRFNRI